MDQGRSLNMSYQEKDIDQDHKGMCMFEERQQSQILKEKHKSRDMNIQSESSQ